LSTEPHRPRLSSPATVTICGAGAAGMAAAISAAREGAQVLLVEMRERPGGTLVSALLHTIAGLYDGAGAFMNDGLPRELAERLMAADPSVHQRRIGRAYVLQVDPSCYLDTVRSWIESDPRITTLYSSKVADVRRAGDRVTEVELTTPHGRRWIAVDALVDTTGSGAVASLIDTTLVEREETTAAGGWIFRMRGAAPEALVLPRKAAVTRAVQAAAAAGQLPPTCGQAWIDIGMHPDELFVKLFVPLRPGWRALEETGAVSRTARETQARLVEFLRTLPGLEAAEVSDTGELGIRDGGRVRGRYCLTRADVESLRKFPDAACKCAWPIELWDSNDGLRLQYLPRDGYYEIPLRCLQVDGCQNLWVAGKSLSADPDAQSSARCVGTCWAMGAAVGRAIASPSMTMEREQPHRGQGAAS
jgi:FAD-dependent oxidoreductase family protein